MSKLYEIIEKPLSGEWGSDDDLGNGIPVLRTTNFTNEGDINYSNVVTRIIEAQKAKEKFLNYGDIIIEKSGGSPAQPVGRVVFFEGEEEKYLFNNFTSVLRLKDKKNNFPRYLFYFLFSSYKKGKTRKFQNKTTGILNLKLDRFLKEIEIPIPPLETQKQIAENLDTAAEILAMRKQQLAELDNLITSIFYDMFGDPLINEKGWDAVILGDLITVLTDYHANGSYESLRDNVQLLDKPDYALMIRTTDLENQNYEDNVKYITKEAYDYLEKSKVFGGEIIINKIGSAGKVYLMPYLNRPVSLAMNQFLLRFNDKTNVLYVYYFLATDFSEKNIKDRVRGAVTKTITKDAVRSIPIILPPLSLQTQFAEIVTKIREQKALVQKAIDETQYLFDSLMSEYFD
ncbi:MAG: restriction endonuclease subunit S [Desulfitobacterium sp.]